MLVSEVIPYQRWRDFATRMAVHGWPDATDARKQKILSNVREFLSWMAVEGAEIRDWDGIGKTVCVGDRMEDFIEAFGFYHEDVDKEHRFANQIRCCVRAGLDVALEPSAGVIGFDVAMLRRMWDGQPPPWVCNYFDPPLQPDTFDQNWVWL